MAGGRPSKYHTHVEPKLLLIEGWYRNGLTLENIANNLNIALSTLMEYKLQYKELSDALKNGQEVIDTMVENALLKAALGYEYMEEASTKDGVADLRKVAHPNTTALIFWLKNRQPKQWRDKQEVEHSGEMKQTVSHDLKKLSPEELKNLEQILSKTTEPE